MSDTTFDTPERLSNPSHYGAQVSLYMHLRGVAWVPPSESMPRVPDTVLRKWASTIGVLAPRMAIAAPEVIANVLEPIARKHITAELDGDSDFEGGPSLRYVISQILPMEQHLAKDGYSWKHTLLVNCDRPYPISAGRPESVPA